MLCPLFLCLGADVNRRTANNDHTVLSLASAGGHVGVVQFLLSKGAEPSHMLRVRLLTATSVVTLFIYLFICL